jgi:xanthine dehydrogenase accessory factor
VKLFPEHLVVVRGGGDLATGVIARLHRAGFPVVVLELAAPLAIRRTVSVARAVTEGTAQVEDLTAQLAGSPVEAITQAATGVIPVVVSRHLPDIPEASVLVDARLAKESLDTSIDQAPLVVALGPGFTAGVDCHAVVETMRGHHLGKVLWTGSAAPNTGVPGTVGGRSVDRVIRASHGGPIVWDVAIGELVEAGHTIGHISREPVRAELGGVVRGLIDPARLVTPGLKVADIDPRGNPAACFEISDKAMSVGGGVLEAILMWLNRSSPS